MVIDVRLSEINSFFLQFLCNGLEFSREIFCVVLKKCHMLYNKISTNHRQPLMQFILFFMKIWYKTSNFYFWHSILTIQSFLN